MAAPISLIIGDLTVIPHKRLPSNAFTAAAHKQLSFQRAQNGKLYSQKNYEKYSVHVQGLAQDMFEDLRHEYQKDIFIDLHFISNRKETITAPGATRLFLTTRRLRTDSNDVLPEVESPSGTVITGVTFSNPLGATQGYVLFTGATPALNDEVIVSYFPIISGQLVDMNSDYNWVDGTESWDCQFEEA